MTLNLDSFNQGSNKKSNSKYKAALGVGSAVSLFGIGSTLAANISLNGGGNVEFGQGVATTAACDEDGFNITPVTRFDNEHGIFRVDSVEVTGVDLTPEGTGYIAGGYLTQEAAKEAHPGQYYDTVTSDWKRTCDNVVLEFKAYTDDEDYALYTDDAYLNSNNTSITSPIGWYQSFEDGTANLESAWSPGFAAIFDSSDDGSDYSSNFGVDAVDFSSIPMSWHGYPTHMYLGTPEYNLTTSNATCVFGTSYENRSPNAAVISKITVQSMKNFPSSYYANRDGLGAPNAYLDEF